MKVYLKDGRSLVGTYHRYRSALSGSEKEILWFNRGGRKIISSETDSIVIDFLVGIPSTDSIGWIFKIIDGPISAFATSPDRSSHTLNHIQKEDGPIEPFTREKLYGYIANNSRATALFKEIFSKSDTRLQKEGAIEAIEEYNNNRFSNLKTVDSLSKLLEKEKDFEKQSQLADMIISLDSTNFIAFELLGDYEKNINQNIEKAYHYYLNAIRFHPRKFGFTELKYKIDSLNKEMIY